MAAAEVAEQVRVRLVPVVPVVEVLVDQTLLVPLVQQTRAAAAAAAVKPRVAVKAAATEVQESLL
jgi:hypothetical protein